MKYFLDTEFIEGFDSPVLRPKRHFIDLISIGIVCEDGRKYHAIGNEWKFKEADQWVQENVIIPLYIDTVHGDNRNRYGANTFHKAYGKSNREISEEILRFFGCWRDHHFWRSPENIEVYGYYADYDWVLFCSLFGRMIDLPKGFPMYCIDLKQTLDEVAESILSEAPASTGNMEGALAAIKIKSDYPQQSNEHNALADAKWNYELYKFLNKTIK
jgi:hypothetical protein